MKSAPARRMPSERLEHGAVAVEPAFFEGGLEHGVLAGDLVGADGHVEALAGGADDVEVGHGGLHQDHVGAFVEVEIDLAHGFAEVGAIHLVGAAVAELGRGVGGFAEGAVEGRGELRGVAEDGRVGQSRLRRGRVRMAATRPSIMSLGATMSAPAWARLTAVRASSSSVGSLSTSKPSPVFDDDAAVAVAGVLAEADVGDEDEFLCGARIA